MFQANKSLIESDRNVWGSVKTSAMMGLKGACCSSGIALMSHQTWKVRRPEPYPSNVEGSHTFCMRSVKSDSLRFVGFPLESRLLQLIDGFHSLMQSQARTCGQRADGSGHRLSEYGAGQVFGGNVSGKGAG